MTKPVRINTRARIYKVMDQSGHAFAQGIPNGENIFVKSGFLPSGVQAGTLIEVSAVAKYDATAVQIINQDGS